jgi:hypothetical protein
VIEETLMKLAFLTRTNFPCTHGAPIRSGFEEVVGVTPWV